MKVKNRGGVEFEVPECIGLPVVFYPAEEPVCLDDDCPKKWGCRLALAALGIKNPYNSNLWPELPEQRFIS